MSEAQDEVSVTSSPHSLARVVDTTGDGRADTLLMDTTGDGKHDTVLAAQVVDTTGDTVGDTVLVDINGDGKYDLAMPLGARSPSAQSLRKMHRRGSGGNMRLSDVPPALRLSGAPSAGLLSDTPAQHRLSDAHSQMTHTRRSTQEPILSPGGRRDSTLSQSGSVSGLQRRPSEGLSATQEQLPRRASGLSHSLRPPLASPAAQDRVSVVPSAVDHRRDSAHSLQSQRQITGYVADQQSRRASGVDVAELDASGVQRRTSQASFSSRRVSGVPAQQELDRSPLQRHQSEVSMSDDQSRSAEPRGGRDEMRLLRERVESLEDETVQLRMRNESLDRLLQGSGEAREATVKNLHDEVQKRAQKVRELEKQQGDKDRRIRELEQKLANEAAKRKQKEAAVRKAEERGKILFQQGIEMGSKNTPDATPRQPGIDPVFDINASFDRTNLPPSHPMSQQQRQQQQLLAQARDCISQLREQLAQQQVELDEKDTFIADLRDKLKEAQGAILANVEGISDLDGKLQQSRRALRWILNSQGNLAPAPSSREPSPSGRSDEGARGGPSVNSPPWGWEPPPYKGRSEQSRGRSVSPERSHPAGQP
eukprot:Hpha_TRINITY_DN11970_c0_g1::TRINITY_DN11970_c0_g1_i2::g.20732::m.20732